MKATWNGVILSESDHTVEIEGNHYFPPESVNHEYLIKSDKHSTCPWKGEASYFTVRINGMENKDAAWTYPNPKPAAAKIKDHVAFWKGIKIEP